VIPARNEEANIANCLRSVMDAAQKTLQAPNIIVVDDCSTDRTAAIAEKFGVCVLRLEHRCGQLSAWASGVADSTTPFVIFVDADCTIDEDALVILLRALSVPGVGVASGRPVPSRANSERQRASGRSLVDRSSNFSSLLLEELKGRLGDHDFVAIGRLLAVRRVAWKIENTSLPHNDREVASAARRAGWRVVWVPEAQVFYEAPSSFVQLEADWVRTSRSRHPQAPQKFDDIPRTTLLRAGFAALRRQPFDALCWLTCRVGFIARGVRRRPLKYLPQPISWDQTPK
jgi:glycosyltransferase involved in cell wall biosynthesis